MRVRIPRGIGSDHLDPLSVFINQQSLTHTHCSSELYSETEAQTQTANTELSTRFELSRVMKTLTSFASKIIVDNHNNNSRDRGFLSSKGFRINNKPKSLFFQSKKLFNARFLQYKAAALQPVSALSSSDGQVCVCFSFFVFFSSFVSGFLDIFVHLITYVYGTFRIFLCLFFRILAVKGFCNRDLLIS